MLQDVIHPPQSEQLQIEGLASPIVDPILTFCDEAELFGAAAEASSCSGCCYEDINNSCYTTNTATTTAATMTTADLSYPCSSGLFASDTTKFDPASLSVLLDTQPDPDISASLNYRFFFDPQEPFDLSSTLHPSQLPIMSTTNFSTTNTFSPDPTAAIPTQSLQSVYEQQECLAQLQPYIGLDPTSTSPTSCSFFDPGGIAGASYLTAGCLGEVNGMYGGGTLGGGAEMVEFQTDNGGGIYGMDSMQSVFNTSDLQEVLSENQHHLANGSGGCSSPTPLTATSNMTSLDESTFKVGRLSVEEKKERINRFMKKRNERNFRKKIKYACRKTLADSRPRVRGRFAKNDEFGEATRPSSSHHEDEDDDEVVIKEEEDMIDSDIFAHITGVNSFKCNYTLQSWI